MDTLAVAGVFEYMRGTFFHGVLMQVAVPCTLSSLGTGIYKYMHVLTTATIRRDSVAQLLVQHIVFTKFIVFIRYYSGGVGGVFL